MINTDPTAGLAIALLIILLIAAIHLLSSGVLVLSDLKDPTEAPVVSVKPPAAPHSDIQMRCKNGYLFYIINGIETKAPSTIPNPCAKELNDAATTIRKGS